MYAYDRILEGGKRFEIFDYSSSRLESRLERVGQGFFDPPSPGGEKKIRLFVMKLETFSDQITFPRGQLTIFIILYEYPDEITECNSDTYLDLETRRLPTYLPS